MIGNRGQLGSPARVARRTLPSALGAAVLALAIAAAPAAQAKPVPNPEFEPFADCPVAVKHVFQCVVATTTSGEFELANKTVPITKPIVLQGGIIEGTHVLVPAADGNTLSRTPLTVPGGLTGIEGLPLGGEVIAVTELAGPVELFAENLTGLGPAVKLPVKVKLENPILGEACYVGSEAEPILLQLTTGTTKPPPPAKPISGNPGTVEPQSVADHHHDQRHLPGRQHVCGTGGERVRRCPAEPTAGHGRRPPGRPAGRGGSQHGGAERNPPGDISEGSQESESGAQKSESGAQEGESGGTRLTAPTP